MSLDPTSILSGIAYLATSYLADWCVVDVVEAQTGAVRRAAGSHRAARYQSLLNEALQFSPSPDSVQRIAKVLRSAAPELSTSPDDASLEAGVEDARHLRTLRALGHASYIIVPLISAGRVVGAVTLVRSNPGDPFERRDLTTASELAMRAALALDNARLYERAKGQANAPVQG
jgi:GAF domain-containing protein